MLNLRDLAQEGDLRNVEAKNATLHALTHSLTRDLMGPFQSIDYLSEVIIQDRDMNPALRRLNCVYI